MNQNCIDVFSKYKLPFETFFHNGISHMSQLHDETELIWIMKGSATIVCNGVSYSLHEQNLFMVNAYQTHSITSSNDSMIITFRFCKSYLERNNHSFEGMNFITRVYTLDELVLKYNEVPLLISQLLGLLISNNSSNLIRYKIIGYYNMLIYELYTMLYKEQTLDVKKKNIPVYLERLRIINKFISERFLTKLTLDELATKIGVSRYRMSHFMKEYIGISFREYLFNMRLEYAVRLLKDSDLPILDVSKSAGFSDVKYLNKLIKERFNTTALKYRKEIRSVTSNKANDLTHYEAFFKELQKCLVRLQQT